MTKPKRSREPKPRTAAQAVARVWTAMDRPWGNYPRTGTDKRNEQMYLEADRAVVDATVDSHRDVLAVLNYLIADRCDHDSKYTMTPLLEKVRACVEERLTERIELPVAL